MLSKRLRAVRKKKGMTQVDLARLVRVRQSYIASLETGAKKNPSLALLGRLAKALDVPVARLLD